MKTCIVCGDKTERPIAAALEHFRLYQGGFWQYVRGNITAFGWLSGMQANLCNIFPIYNTLSNWRHRKSKLVIPKELQ